MNKPTDRKGKPPAPRKSAELRDDAAVNAYTHDGQRRIQDSQVQRRQPVSNDQRQGE